MKNRVSDHIQQNVYGLIAIFIALSGTAYAIDGPLDGQNRVGSADIINGEVSTADVGNAQVTAPKIAFNSINAARITDGEVGAAEVGQGAVGTNEVANESLAGVDVANGSLTSNDLAKHTLVRDDLAFEVDDVLTVRVSDLGNSLDGVSDATHIDKLGDGRYRVFFGRDVSACRPQATLIAGGIAPSNGEISVSFAPAGDDHVDVHTFDSTAFGGAPPAHSDRSFSLALFC